MTGLFLVGCCISLAFSVDWALHIVAERRICPECGTRTYTHGLFTWACFNPEHGENANRHCGGCYNDD